MPFTDPLPPLPDARLPVVNQDGTFRSEWVVFFRSLLLWLKRLAASV